MEKPVFPQDISNADLEVLKKMEDEHLRLQRQVRNIQADRQQRSMGVHPQFRRQDEQLRGLRAEYLSLLKDLKIARSGAHKKRDKKMKMELNRALLLRKKSEIECEDGETLMKQIEDLVRRNSKSMLVLRKSVTATMGELLERRFTSEHRLVSTENRLETAMRRFNTVQYENKQIREEIESMLKDRALFNQAWSKMLTALNKGKKFLNDLFESSTLAYDQRDEWVTKLRSVQEKGKVDQMMQTQEMRDLQKAYDHEMKLYAFLAKKGVMRINKHQEQREEEEKKKEEERLRKAILEHVNILEEISNYSAGQTVSAIIEGFKKKEQENFAIYKMLTEYCAENVVLRKDLDRTVQMLEDRRDWNEQQDVRRGRNLEELKKTIEEQREVTETLRNRVRERDELISNIIEKIQGLFTMLDCSLEPFQGLLGDRQPSRWTLGLTLNLITDKIQELVEIVYYYERYIQKKTEKTTSRLKKYTIHAESIEYWTAVPITQFVRADPCPACIEARWLNRVSEIAEEPFTKEMAMAAIVELNADPSYVRSDSIHPLADCRAPRSRVILANRYMQQ